jgi:hypothetical protein
MAACAKEELAVSVTAAVAKRRDAVTGRGIARFNVANRGIMIVGIQKIRWRSGPGLSASRTPCLIWTHSLVHSSTQCQPQIGLVTDQTFNGQLRDTNIQLLCQKSHSSSMPCSVVSRRPSSVAVICPHCSYQYDLAATD